VHSGARRAAREEGLVDADAGKLILPAEFDVHCVTDGRVISLRHLPICTTSGICAPSGTLFSVKFPAVSVSAYVIGSPEKSASHEQEVLLTPMGKGWSYPPWEFGT
jgi:hypothetical protein